MMDKVWETGKPPHDTLVEVEYDGKVWFAKAMWGDPKTGVLPHWELGRDGNLQVSPGGIKRWRRL